VSNTAGRSPADKERYMGLDVGTRTVGVAVSDPLGLTAQPRTVLRRQSLQVDVQTLCDMARRDEITGFVVGLPRRTSGEEGKEAAFVRRFASALNAESGIPIYFVDERYTTAMAQNTLIAAGVRRARRRNVVDKMAAVFILQTFLAQRRKGMYNKSESPRE
jgi:putative Holliday junction resolvase